MPGTDCFIFFISYYYLSKSLPSFLGSSGTNSKGPPKQPQLPSRYPHSLLPCRRQWLHTDLRSLQPIVFQYNPSTLRDQDAMVNLDLKRLLVFTFFADPQVNNAVKSGSQSVLPQFSMLDSSSVFAQPVLPSILQKLNPFFRIPDWLPVLPELTFPPSSQSWVGTDRQYPVPPSEDPFYFPHPSQYQYLSPGEIIAIRPVGVPLFFRNARAAFQVSFRSETTFGEPTADITTIIVPHNNDSQNIVSYQVFEDASSLTACPSYALLTGVYDPTVDLLLAQGWVVNVPDHEGIRSAFGAGKRSGKITLDSIRALFSGANYMGISNTQVSMYGYSGGSIATGHAMEMQPIYAPDIQFTAAAVGGYVCNLTSTLESINQGLFAGLALAGLAGLMTEYPEFNRYMETQLKRGSRWRFDLVKKHGLVWVLLNYLGEDVFAYFHDSQRQLLSHPSVRSALDNELLGRTAPQIPVYCHQGVQDQVISVHGVDRVVDFYAKGGTPIVDQRNALIEHTAESLLGSVSVIRFLKATFNGHIPSATYSWQEATQAELVEPRGPASRSELRQIAYGDYW